MVIDTGQKYPWEVEIRWKKWTYPWEVEVELVLENQYLPG